MDKSTIMTEIAKNVGRRGNSDMIYQPLYDSFKLDRAPFIHTFYCVPIGQREKNEVICKTMEDTNMFVTGQLTMGNEFYATGIGVYFVPNCNAEPKAINRREDIADSICMLSHGHLQFIVGSRRYLEIAPLAAMPPQFPMYWARDDKALAHLFLEGATKADGPGIRVQKPFEMVPIYIMERQNFEIIVRMDNVFELYNMGKLAVMLDGFLFRDLS